MGLSISTGRTGWLNTMARNTIRVERFKFSDVSTIGRLFLDQDLLCYTLEDCVRDHKIPGQTAIPEGTYELTTTFSNRFQRVMPLLMNVPNYEGVRIHCGNTDKDTEGCLLVGMRYGENVIYDSRKAYDLLFPEIQKRLAEGKLYISIMREVA